MKPITPICLSVIVLLMVTSCSEAVKDNLPQITGYDQEMLKSGEDLDIESFDIIPLEQTDKSIITMIKRVEIIDTLLIVETDAKLLAFNMNGKFIHQYGERGNAPNEYVGISSCIFNQKNNTVIIIDGAANKMITFDINGNYLSSNKMDEDFLMWTNAGICIDDETILFNSRIYGDINDVYTLVNLEKGEKNVIYKFPGKTENVGTPIGNSTISMFKDECKLIIPFDNKIYVLKNGKMIPKMSVVTKKKMVTEEQQKQITDYGIFAYVEFMNDGYFPGFTGIYENANYLFLETTFGANYFLINKGTNSGRLYKYSISEELKTLPLMRLIACHDNYLIGVQTAWNLREMKNQFPDTITDKNLLKLKNYVDTFDYDGNPCLFLYKIK